MGNLGGLLAFPINVIPFVFLVLLIAFTLHEFAHAYVADKFGDPTPRQMGRVTLNPRVHLDILGTILIFIAGFGWAKPVLINRANFSRPRLMGIIVSLVGPLSNLLIGFIGVVILYFLNYFHALNGASVGVQQAVSVFLNFLISLNLVLFVFNLIPLPPLDGYRILEDLLPRSWAYRLQKLQQWSIFIFMLLVFIPPISRVTLGPLFTFGIRLQYVFHSWLTALFPVG
ncbi:MAG: site-2 protease family protein [Paenibacillaceae bacterium]|jgi:Zn-dependent protease|nr:site-2 protease family protein [Paenibacillaceae bacterium]